MMRQALLLIVITASLTSCAQKEDVEKKFNEYQLSAKFLTTNLKDADAEHYFDLKTTIVNGAETKIVESTFDPSKNVGKRWNLVSVNQVSPLIKEIKEFDKTHNTTQEGVNGQIDASSWNIEKDDDAYLVLSFRHDKKSLPRKFSFLGDCKGLAYYNKKTERLEKTEFVNEKPLKIKVFNVTRLDMVVHYKFNHEDAVYLIHTEELDMEVMLLGQIVPIKEINEYGNYSKAE